MRTIWLTLVALLTLHCAAEAQECEIAAYAFSDGTGSLIQPSESVPFSAYVVMHVENTVAAAAYELTIPSLNRDVFLQARFSAPNGQGLAIDEPTGTNVALLECVIGFDGNPVLVDEYVFIALPTLYCDTWTVGPNSSQDPDFPQYVTCNDITLDCSAGPELFVGCWVATEETSFSEIKSLYR